MKNKMIAVFTVMTLLGLGTPVFAATIEYKKQLVVPSIDEKVLPVNARGLPHQLIEEVDCGDTTYRSWQVTTFRSMTPQGSFGYLVFEARRGTAAKWHIERWSNSPSYSRSVSFFHCDEDDDVYVMLYEASSRQGWSAFRVLKVGFDRFDQASVWDFNEGMQTPARAWYFGTSNRISPILMDGIVQIPGRLSVQPENATIAGDSRPQTIEPNGVLRHSLPWYRDLNQAKNEGKTIDAVFYRMHDGYAVKETVYTCPSSSPSSACDETITLYRIHDGEARYSIVDSLPVGKLAGEGYRIFMGESGVVLESPDHNKMLLHGLPNQSEAGPIYTVSGSMLAEDEARLYMRYLMTNIETGNQQYWEAIIGKE